MSHRAIRCLPTRLSLALSAGLLLAPAIPLMATTRPVSSCADDGGATTLRSVIAASETGDTIDLSTLPGADPACTSSKITLTQGQIAIDHDLTIAGPGAKALAVIGTGTTNMFYGSDASSYLAFRDITISGGANSTSKRGGCIEGSGEVRLDATTVSGCSLTLVGGGIKYTARAFGGGVYGNVLRLTNGSVVSGNSDTIMSGASYVFGGGVAADMLYCTDSTISGNFSSVGGGAAYAHNSTITRCTIDSNVTGGYGGAMLVWTGGTLSVSESTISGNSALVGSAVFTRTSLSMNNSTVAFNYASKSQGAAIASTGDITLKSSIVAQNLNMDGSNIDVSTGSGTIHGVANLIGYTTSTAAAGAIVSSANPRLVPLGNHGGLTQTHALLATSPAIGIGNNVLALANDQRGAGFAREVPTGKPDIGAYERQAVDDELFYDGYEP